MQMIRGLGWNPDKPDARDHKFSVIHKAASSPVVYSIRDLIIEMLDQGPLGSCVTQAITQGIRVVDKRNAPTTTPALTSRFWAYYYSRAQDGLEKVDSGTELRTCIKVLNALGRPPESAWPQVLTDLNSASPTFTKKPPPNVNMLAHDKRLASYVRIDATGNARAEAVRQSISGKKPVAFGTDVGYSFLDSSGPSKNVPPPLTEQIAGGHAMLIIAYDQDGAWVCNSWGPDWRDTGFVHLSWAYILWAQTSDLWSLDLPLAA
jgi:C1A family cysteine protease